MNDSASLALRNISVRYPTKRNAFGRPIAFHDAVRDVSFEVQSGECLGIVGESGSGKSTIAQTIVGLVEPASGSVLWNGEPLGPAGRRSRELASAIQLVFQDPQASLDPRMRVHDIVSEGLAIRGGIPQRERRKRAGDLLEMVGLPVAALTRFPHAFSGGQRQRIAIARALALGPRVLVLDEPTSALDVSIQAQILNLLLDLQTRLGLTYVLISHDISVVAHLSHRVIVMRSGELVEEGQASQVLSAPAHAYTRQLVAAVPRVG